VILVLVTLVMLVLGAVTGEIATMLGVGLVVGLTLGHVQVLDAELL
jgi:hypothetical protein